MYVRFDLTQRYFVRMGRGIRPSDISGIYIQIFLLGETVYNLRNPYDLVVLVKLFLLVGLGKLFLQLS